MKIAATMSLFAQLRGRMGVAGMLLRKLQMGSAVHSAQSEIQAAAVLSVLQSQGHQLTADEKAQLSSMIDGCAFEEKDALELLGQLRLKTGSRRGAQDMRAYPYYLSQSQWAMGKVNVEAAIGVSIDVVVHRLGGVNVCEHTLKRMTSVSLALCSNPLGFFDADAKAATLLQVKTSYRRVVRAVKDLQKTQPSRKPYIVKLPCNPADLEQAHPEAGFKIEGCPKRMLPWGACVVALLWQCHSCTINDARTLLW